MNRPGPSPVPTFVVDFFSPTPREKLSVRMGKQKPSEITLRDDLTFVAERYRNIVEQGGEKLARPNRSLKVKRVDERDEQALDSVSLKELRNCRDTDRVETLAWTCC